MHRERLTQYDDRPEEMITYFKYYGPHFNRKLCEFATSLMYKEKDGKREFITPYTKELVELMLKQNNITLYNKLLYDHVYVANMCKADFLGSSIQDEQHLAKYVKDVIDDEDGYDGLVFNRWYADMCSTGMAVDWESVL